MITYFQKVITLNPRLPQAYLDLGEAYRVLGEKKHAVETFSRLLGLFPDDEKIDVQVIEAYGRAVKDDPRDELYKEKLKVKYNSFILLEKKEKVC